MQGVVDHYVSLQGRETGECIYCGKRDAPLGTEHAVPYGLNGPWTLLRASCDACAKITSRFEHDVFFDEPRQSEQDLTFHGSPRDKTEEQ